MRVQKIAILTEVMDFTDAEDAAFWPLYREYDGEMARLGDERVALIAEYAANYSMLTDAIADKLAARALDLEARRQATKAKYYERIKKALSPRTALRFLQVEHQLLLHHRPADLGRASHRQVTEDTPMQIPGVPWLAAMLVIAAGVSLSADRVRLRSGKIVEGPVHRRRQQDRPRPPRQRPGVRESGSRTRLASSSPRENRRRRRRAGRNRRRQPQAARAGPAAR